jgi:hypothetical protein
MSTRKSAEQRCRAAGATKESDLADSSADIQAAQREYTVVQTVKFTTFEGVEYRST